MQDINILMEEKDKISYEIKKLESEIKTSTLGKKLEALKKKKIYISKKITLYKKRSLLKNLHR